ncbi:MAG: TRAP transporter small permease subunit [Arenicellales bacterium]|jgi:TRAP-type mannitol/chloroaromatic compound transport system permease small subunit|nr:TRAP transporter small permease subunit [Arenicellales bacterium]MDP6947601.1 TRAP transporter small permease subunit [Arenicellales bacterium]
MRDSTAAIHNPLIDSIDHFVLAVGRVIAWANVLLIGVIILNVILRYGGRWMQQDLGIEMSWLFQDLGGPKLEELQWHLYALTVMMGLSYAQSTDSHIRVDIIAEKLSERTVRKWEVFGIIFFLLPFIYMVFIHSLDFVADSWRINEHSDAPAGLPWRWAVKSVIPVSFAMLGIAVLARLARDLMFLVKTKADNTSKEHD